MNFCPKCGASRKLDDKFCSTCGTPVSPTVTQVKPTPAPSYPARKNAGWYQDPRDAKQRRYWDGERWTERAIPILSKDRAHTAKPSATQDAAKKSSVGSWIIGTAIAAAVIIGFAACVSGQASGGNDTDHDTSLEAELQCEARVKERLKSPTTASFNDTTAVKNGSSWTVTGTVDAENAFGAKLRSEFGCSVTIAGDSATVRVDYIN